MILVIHIGAGWEKVGRLNTVLNKMNLQFSLIFEGKTFGNYEGQGYLCHPKK